MENLYPGTPVYLALGLAVAIAGITINLMVSEVALKSKIGMPIFAATVVALALVGSAVHVLGSISLMAIASFSADKTGIGFIQLLHFGIVACATLSAFCLYLQALAVHYRASFSLSHL